MFTEHCISPIVIRVTVLQVVLLHASIPDSMDLNLANKVGPFGDRDRPQQQPPLIREMQVEEVHHNNEEQPGPYSIFDLIKNDIIYVRMRLREFGRYWRNVLQNISFDRFVEFCRWVLRFVISFYGDVENEKLHNRTSLNNNEVDIPENKGIKVCSLIDVTQVLNDDDCGNKKGIKRRCHLSSKHWTSYSVKEYEYDSPESINDFQIQSVNQPLFTENQQLFVDDDFDRASAASTRQSNYESDMKAIQQELEYLRRTLESLTGKAPIVPPRNGSPSSRSDDSAYLEPNSSAFSSRKNSLKKPVRKLPPVCPPTNLPPPPPPPPLPLHLPSLPSSSKELLTQTQASLSPKKCAVVRPSVQDITTVRLRKTQFPKSPGGTPLERIALHDSGHFLEDALRRRFVAMHGCQDDGHESIQTPSDDSDWDTDDDPVSP